MEGRKIRWNAWWWRV